MADLSPERWQAISPYLDQALDLDDAGRDALIQSLRSQDAGLADTLQGLLEEHCRLREEGFLEQSPLGAETERGRQIGAYTIRTLIAQGGMGSVWLAERTDGRFERQVAVKFLSFALLGQGEERFLREGRILGRLSHPHIAELLDAGVVSGQPYLVLEYVDGEPIDQYCERHNLDIASRIQLLLSVMEAVSHAHANLIVHRDIKPSNVLVRSDGQVRLLDFGIAKLMEDGETGPTRDGSAMTLLYAAPEQLSGDPVTTATDVYSLGLLLYLLLSGTHPAGPGPHSAAILMRKILEEPPPPLTGSQCDGTRIEKDLEIITQKALRKNPSERYPSVAAMADDLKRFLRRAPILARPDSTAYRARRFLQRNRLAVVLASLALAATIAGVVGIVIQARDARRQRDFALRQLVRAETTNDLNTFLLSDGLTPGQPVTIGELLGRAEQLISRQPEAERADLLVSIGRQYGSLDEDTKALQILQEAYRLAQRSTDPSSRARAACALASELVRTGEHDRSEALFQEGLRQLPEDPVYALDRAYCLRSGSKIARHRGTAQVAIERTLAADQLLRTAPTGLLHLRIKMDLAEDYRMDGRFLDAIQTSEQAAAMLRTLGRDETQLAGTLYNNWALALGMAGRTLEAEPLYRRAIAINSSDKTIPASPMLLINYGRILRDLGRFREANDYVERGISRAQATGSKVVTGQALLLRASIYRGLGDIRNAERCIAELEPIWSGIYPKGHLAFASISSEKSQNALMNGDMQEALSAANRAYELALEAARQGQDASALPVMLLRRGRVHLAMKNWPAAERDLRESLKQIGERPSLTGQTKLALAEALIGAGRNGEAAPLLDQAQADLRHAVGPDHPDTRRAFALEKSR